MRTRRISPLLLVVMVLAATSAAADDLGHDDPLGASPEIAAILDLEPGPRLGRAIDALTEAQVRGAVRTANGARRWLREYSKRNVQTVLP